MNIGGNILEYEGTTEEPTADLMTMKILFSCVLSTPGAKFMTIDIKNLLKNKAKRETTHASSSRVNARIHHDAL